jgi:hypothetical protein
VRGEARQVDWIGLAIDEAARCADSRSIPTANCGELSCTPAAVGVGEVTDGHLRQVLQPIGGIADFHRRRGVIE